MAGSGPKAVPQAASGEPLVAGVGRAARRQATLERLDAAAMRLFAERPFDEVTTDEVAAAAGISRRTFFRYCATKDDLLLRAYRERMQALMIALEERPSDEPLLDSFRHSLLAVAESYERDHDVLVQRWAIISTVPRALARSTSELTTFRASLAETVAARLPVSRDREMRAAIVAHSLVNAVDIAFGVWLSGPGGNFAALAEQALDLAESGLGVVMAGAVPASRRTGTRTRRRRPGVASSGR